MISQEPDEASGWIHPDDSHDNDTTTTTSVLHTKDGAPYIICRSEKEFSNPTTDKGLKPEDVVKDLNLNLGQSLIQRQNNPSVLLWTIQLLDTICFVWWERIFFALYQSIPVGIRRALTFVSWNIYFRIHKFLLGRKTGMHPSQSYEFHALTTVMWWSRFFPITPRRMRFSLSQLSACVHHAVPSSRMEIINETVEVKDSSSGSLPPQQKDHCTVEGIYLHRRTDGKPTEEIIFWVYGGAYLAGDTYGNLSPADWVGEQCDMDVFLPQIRLAPEADFDDVMWDVLLAYQWLCQKSNVDPSKITILGISSGGAACVRLMQMIAEYQRNEPMLPYYMAIVTQQLTMPKGAVLFAPYLDYTKEKKGSFLHYPQLDLIVNEAVQDYGLPYLEGFIPYGRRRDYSPVYRSMEGLSPMCVIVSEHESVYDMNIEFVNRARKQNVSVTIGVWKYMCHVFSFLFGFIPEGKLSMDFACQWIRQQQQI